MNFKKTIINICSFPTENIIILSFFHSIALNPIFHFPQPSIIDYCAKLHQTKLGLRTQSFQQNGILGFCSGNSVVIQHPAWAGPFRFLYSTFLISFGLFFCLVFFLVFIAKWMFVCRQGIYAGL